MCYPLCVITIPPVPKFALKWQIHIDHLPSSWVAIIKHSIIWTLANEKRWRDRDIELYVEGISIPYMKNILTNYNQSFDIQTMRAKPFLSFYNDEIDRKEKDLELGKIFISQTLVYEHAKEQEMDCFEWLIYVCTLATLEVMRITNKKHTIYKKIVFNKFGVSINPKIKNKNH